MYINKVCSVPPLYCTALVSCSAFFWARGKNQTLKKDSKSWNAEQTNSICFFLLQTVSFKLRKREESTGPEWEWLNYVKAEAAHKKQHAKRGKTKIQTHKKCKEKKKWKGKARSRESKCRRYYSTVEKFGLGNDIILHITLKGNNFK